MIPRGPDHRTGPDSPPSGGGGGAAGNRFDRWAEIYDRWVASAPICEQHPRFYVPLYTGTEGPVVELGVGNGRLVLEAARRGRSMIGVDSSPAMLDICSRRAAEEGLSEHVTLVEGDFRDFRLPEPATLIAIPFHSIGHLISLEEKRVAIHHIYDVLAPGGRLVFDHFVYDPAYAEKHEGIQTLRDIHRREGGGTSYLWVSVRSSPAEQRMEIICVEDRATASGRVEERTIRELEFSWIDPAQSRALLGECGFEIEEAFGGFDRSPLTEESPTQVWVARKPG